MKAEKERLNERNAAKAKGTKVGGSEQGFDDASDGGMKGGGAGGSRAKARPV